MLNLPVIADERLDVPERVLGAVGRTTTAEALLGMLALRPMSGYDLRAMMARSTANFWQESFGQIYPALKKLVAEGLAEVQEEGGDGKRLRKVYRLTDAGHARLGEWFGAASQRQTIRDEVLLKLFFGVKAPRGALLAMMRERRKSYADDLERYRALEVQLPKAQRENPGLPFFLLTLRKGLIDAEAQLQWSDETIAALEAMESSG
jgi:PadR family transcriptional regulator AphA